jgi:hypothetical protein
VSDKNYIKDISAIYENAFFKKNIEIVEEKAVKALNTFPQAIDKKPVVKKDGTDSKAFFHKNSGPENAEGVKDILDPKTAKDNNAFEPKKFSQNTGKSIKENINTFMSKSVFDKLFEDVMKDDALDLGITAGPEGDQADNETLGETEVSGDVSFTLPRDVAQKLHDVLMAALESGEEASSDEDSLGDDETGASDEDEEKNKTSTLSGGVSGAVPIAGEAVDIEELPDSKGQQLQKFNNKVPGTLGSAKPGKAQAAVKGDVDGKGKVLPDSKGHVLTQKNNNVAGVIKGGGKGDQNLFQTN